MIIIQSILLTAILVVIWLFAKLNIWMKLGITFVTGLMFGASGFATAGDIFHIIGRIFHGIAELIDFFGV